MPLTDFFKPAINFAIDFSSSWRFPVAIAGALGIEAFIKDRMNVPNLANDLIFANSGFWISGIAGGSPLGSLLFAITHYMIDRYKGINERDNRIESLKLFAAGFLTFIFFGAHTIMPQQAAHDNTINSSPDIQRTFSVVAGMDTAFTILGLFCLFAEKMFGIKISGKLCAEAFAAYGFLIPGKMLAAFVASDSTAAAVLIPALATGVGATVGTLFYKAYIACCPQENNNGYRSLNSDPQDTTLDIGSADQQSEQDETLDNGADNPDDIGVGIGDHRSTPAHGI